VAHVKVVQAYVVVTILAFFKKHKSLIVKDGDIIDCARFLTFDEYSQVLNIGLHNGEPRDELYLRIDLWREFNHVVRDGQGNDPIIDYAYAFNYGEILPLVRANTDITKMDTYIANCHEILSLIQSDTDDDTFPMRAEIYRNIGDFDACLVSLLQLNDAKKYESYIDTVRTEANKGNRLTVRIEWLC